MTPENRETKLWYFFIAWCSFCSIISLILSKTNMPSAISYGIKDGFIYFVFLLFFSRWGLTIRITHSLIITLFFLLFLVLNYLIKNPGYTSPLNNIRQIISPILVLFTFLSVRPVVSNPITFRNTINWTVLLVLFFGFFELAFSVWEKVNLANYFLDKGIPVNNDGLSYMFYEPMFNYIKRMTSFFIDPISLGHFFSTTILFIFFSGLYNINKSNHYFFLSKKAIIYLSFIGLILTFSKGAWLQLLIGCILLTKKINVFFKFILLLTPLGFLFLLPDDSLTGILIHLKGTINSILSISFFGYGIGTVGNYAKMFSSNITLYYQLGISDTYLGSLLGQIGIIGLLLWILIMLFILNKFSSSKHNFFVATGIFFSVFIVSAMSENTMNITSFLMPSLYIALAARSDEFIAKYNESQA